MGREIQLSRPSEERTFCLFQLFQSLPAIQAGTEVTIRSVDDAGSALA